MVESPVEVQRKLVLSRRYLRTAQLVTNDNTVTHEMGHGRRRRPLNHRAILSYTMHSRYQERLSTDGVR